MVTRAGLPCQDLEFVQFHPTGRQIMRFVADIPSLGDSALLCLSPWDFLLLPRGGEATLTPLGLVLAMMAPWPSP